MKRRAARVDANQAAIVEALRSIGCSVLSLASQGNGCPDILVAKPSMGTMNLLMEIKDGKKPPSARKLSDDELKFHGSWLGPIAVVDSVDSALRAVIAYTR